MFDYHRVFEVDVKVARIFNTYGPRMRQDRQTVNAKISAATTRAPLAPGKPEDTLPPSALR